MMTALPSGRTKPSTERVDGSPSGRGLRPVTTSEMPALRFDCITCRFADRSRRLESYTAIRDVTLSVGKGEFLSVVGPTGCGKSTLLNVAAGLLAPSSGRLTVFGEELSDLNRKAAYLFQAEALMPWCSATDNIAAGLQFRGVSKAEARAQATEWLVRVGLAAHGDKYPHQLSGGMRKRVALAQALILDPPILLMDEPFSALDVQTRQLMENELLRLWSANRKSVVFVTHDLEEAISMSDRVAVLSAGPGATVIAEFPIDLPRPREVAEIRMTQQFLTVHAAIWQVLKAEVAKSHAQANA
jgi:NitT/TauT family transport system ATP-binding protein